MDIYDIESKETNQEEHKFSGIWIRIEDLLNPNLRSFEIYLLSLIRTLESNEGCSASNEYLGKILSTNKNWVSTCIGILKEKGYIYQEKFDGRKRILRTIKENNYGRR